MNQSSANPFADGFEKLLTPSYDNPHFFYTVGQSPNYSVQWNFLVGDFAQ